MKKIQLFSNQNLKLDDKQGIQDSDDVDKIQMRPALRVKSAPSTYDCPSDGRQAKKDFAHPLKDLDEEMEEI